MLTKDHPALTIKASTIKDNGALDFSRVLTMHRLTSSDRFHCSLPFGLLTVGLIGFLFASSFATSAFAMQSDEEFTKQRNKMVDIAVVGAGVTSERVIQSMRDTPRHEFVPKRLRKERSYLDAGVPIGESQTISSPFIVAYMTQELDPKPTDKVLEIGTGSGYQAAILSPLVKEVYSIEIVERLGKGAAKVLKKLEYKNVFTKIGDGYLGWEEHAPFDKVIVTCSPEDIPQPLIDQLKEGGTIVVPMGERHQQTLYLMEKKDGKMVRKALRPTLFVPMTGTAEVKRKVLPDPRNPKLVNGDFEEGLNEQGFASGWYYQRQLTLEDDEEAPSGDSFVQFNNKVPGQLSQVMQAFAIDGRQVTLIEFSASVACEDVVIGPGKYDLPVVVLTFYDDQRKDLNSAVIGPFKNSRDWEKHRRNVRVPIAAREAIVRIGLFGATGTAKFDEIGIEALEKRPEKKKN